MECVLQYLDDLDDLYGMAGLIRERVRRIGFAILSVSVIAAGAIAGIVLALAHPPIGLAVSTLLFVTLLYRSVTGRIANLPHPAR